MDVPAKAPGEVTQGDESKAASASCCHYWAHGQAERTLGSGAAALPARLGSRFSRKTPPRCQEWTAGPLVPTRCVRPLQFPTDANRVCLHNICSCHICRDTSVPPGRIHFLSPASVLYERLVTKFTVRGFTADNPPDRALSELP